MKLKLRVYISLIATVLIILIGYLIYREGTLPVNKTATSYQTFVIEQGSGLQEIAKKLEKEGLIRNRVVFFIVVKGLGIEKNIQAGDFRLSPSMSATQVATELTHGTLDIWVTLPEGLRNEEVAEKLSDALDIPEIELLTPMEGKEGYLFPDTYLMARNASPEAIIKRLENTFHEKYSPEIKEKARRLRLTQKEVVTIASLVEREAKFDEDRVPIASVILRRYQEGIPLQIDATIQYVLGYQSSEKRWWKRNVADDLEVASPYNTYKNVGLPPTPIANPGLASITAAVSANPATPYLFYVHDRQGHAHFARNGEEHEQNIEKYLR